MSYQCQVCGKVHDDLPDISFDKPFHWWDVPEEERERRIDLTSDTCIIDDKHFFIRGVIEIPVRNYPYSFGFGVWVSQKPENFNTYLQNFNCDRIGPFFGWLCTRVDYYELDTLLLKTMVHFQGDDRRPLIELEPTAHPLSLDCKQGITLDKAWEIVHYYLDTDSF